MLKRDEASARLRTMYSPTWLAGRLDKLPPKLADAGRALLAVDKDGKPLDWSVRNKKIEEQTPKLFALKPAERLKLFAALFPNLADDLEATFQLRAGLPYPMGYNRRAYRAPNDPTAMAAPCFHALASILQALQGYQPDGPAWVAAWAPHLDNTHTLGLLCAAAIDRGSDEVFEVLKDSATNDHEVGNMGRHVVTGLLCASRPDGWGFVEKLLLAAQRQEGLRQVILEAIDESHPQAFRRMLALILDNDLIRFSATVRAIDVWFGLQWTALTPAVLRDTVRRVQTLLDDEKARGQALASGAGEDFFFALWALAFEDAHRAIAAAKAAVKDADVERRYAAVHLLCDMSLDAARDATAAFIDDPDLRIACKAFNNSELKSLSFEQTVRLLQRIPEKPKAEGALLWPWNHQHVHRSWPADRLPALLGKRSPEDLLPYLPAMGYGGKNETIKRLAAQKTWSPVTRQAMLALLGDKDRYARSNAAAALRTATLTDDELLSLEPLLLKKASDVRSSVTSLLADRKPAKALESADRLLAHKKPEPRLGGLEVLRLLVGKKQAVAECQRRAAAYAAAHEERGDAEKAAIEEVLDYGKPKPTLDDALGLMTTPLPTPPEPKPRKAVTVSKAAVAVLKALDALVDQHAKEMIAVKTYRGEETVALGVAWYFPAPDLAVPAAGQEANLPLRDVWQRWLKERPAAQRDKDGLELLRAAAWANVGTDEWTKGRQNEAAHWHEARDRWANGLAPVDLKYGRQVANVLNWLLFLDPPAESAKWVLDTTESFFSLVPEKERTKVIALDASWNQRNNHWRASSLPNTWYANVAQPMKARTAAAWADADKARWFRLAAWRDRPAPRVRRERPDLQVLLDGGASDVDLYDHLIGPEQTWYSLSGLTQHPPREVLADRPRLAAAVAACRDRVLEVELARGENPTAASPVARHVAGCYGLDLLMRLLGAIGGRPFNDSYYSREGRAEVFTHLIKACHPLPADTPEAFAARVAEAKVPPERLLQLAFLAPQWLRHVEQAVGWDGYREAVYWLFAHTEGSPAWGLEEAAEPGFKPDEAWSRLLRDRTPLTPAERAEHMVDVDWFRRAYEPLGKRRWEALLAAAKHGPGGRSRAKKAGSLADVILGRAKKKDLVSRIKLKQHREAVRLLGLLPMARGDRRDKDLQSRYRVLMGYRRHARSLSPMGREGALRDLEIGLANLARTAGYPDATRLGWALEAREMADLAAGPVSVTQQGVTVTLALNAENKPEVTVRRGDKPLKAVPPAVRKHKKVVELTSRTAELRRQASRVRQGLEAMMCRAEAFSGAELKQLFGHPLLRPLLERLVLVGEGIAGYPTAEGRALRDHAGKLEPVKDAERLRLAHPHDLFALGDWDKWQADCFAAERVQPFKQVFRELYVLTKQEREDRIESKRYAGHQVNPSQSTALFGGRGWATTDGVFKTFHEAGIVAEAYVEHHGWTAAEVEGLTFGPIRFRKRGEWQPLPLEEVPPVIFSEVMRDGDLVVSVAHVGGVDPEASASTVEMRATLLRETCKLFGLKNVTIKDRHALIDGTLADYTVHLGSAGVHKMPGGMVCLVAVPAQHRGRLFLPFADDDPKTAEVISKVLLLSRDHEIQDPTVLEQLQ